MTTWLRGKGGAGWLCVFAALYFLLQPGLPVWAQSPEEVLLVVNRRSKASVRIAEDYARLRGIPPEHIAYVRVPMKYCSGAAEVTPKQFTKYIWRPLMAWVEEHDPDGRLLAWIYSVDFPVRIATSPPMSLMGVTFVRNKLPPSDQIKAGTYFSSLFAGPDPKGPPPAPTLPLRRVRETLETNMPLPSMMLGYVGKGGSTEKSVWRGLEKGRASDGTRPKGRFFFESRENPRSKCRAWQFEAVCEELRKHGQEARILSYYPTNATGIMGLQIGRANAPGFDGNEYLPGAMADNLTSWGAAFDKTGQQRCTRWIDAGVTCSAGTVTEPYAIWTKFPSARFYVHYVEGATALESFYYSIRCPLQILLLGDPLACPWCGGGTGTGGAPARVDVPGG